MWLTLQLCTVQQYVSIRARCQGRPNQNGIRCHRGQLMLGTDIAVMPATDLRPLHEILEAK